MQTGSPCPLPGCRGQLVVGNTRLIRDHAGRAIYRQWLLVCKLCRQRPANNKQIVDLTAHPPRPPRATSSTSLGK